MKQPYREPEQIHVDPIPKDFEFYFSEYGVWLFSGLLLVTIASVAYELETWKPPPPKPCSEMAEVLAKDLPARCTKIYDPDGGAI